VRRHPDILPRCALTSSEETVKNSPAFFTKPTEFLAWFFSVV
jgi:hypothetical protein